MLVKQPRTRVDLGTIVEYKNENKLQVKWQMAGPWTSLSTLFKKITVRYCLCRIVCRSVPHINHLLNFHCVAVKSLNSIASTKAEVDSRKVQLKSEIYSCRDNPQVTSLSRELEYVQWIILHWNDHHSKALSRFLAAFELIITRATCMRSSVLEFMHIVQLISIKLIIISHLHSL